MVEEVLGYGLGGAPTPVRMLAEWRFDLLLGTAAVVLAVLYLLGVRRVRAAGGRWPIQRTAGWLLGCLVLLLATSSGVGRYAPAVFSVHLAATAAIAVVAPLCLVLGAPLTLAARTVRAGPDGAVPGAREWLRAMYTSMPVRALTSPAVAVAAFVGTFYLLYLAGLYDALAGSHLAHVLTNVWVLAVGSLFFWVTVGPDPLPRPPAPAARVVAALVALAAYAFLLVSVVNAGTVVAAEYYTSLRRGFFDDVAADQRLGGNLAWVGGELPLLLAAVLATVRWASVDERRARRRDEQIDREGDEELAASNAMLRGLDGAPREPNRPARRF